MMMRDTMGKKTLKAVGLEPLNIKLKKLDPNAVIPKYAHDGDVGMDITAIAVDYDEENDLYIYHTGLAIETDRHFGIFLFPRSSNRRTDAYLTNHVGISDSYLYRGEIMFCFKNRDSIETNAMKEGFSLLSTMIGNRVDIDYSLQCAIGRYKTALAKNPLDLAPYKVGERIGQMVVMPYPNVTIEEVDKLSDTVRQDGGFGSTGK